MRKRVLVESVAKWLCLALVWTLGGCADNSGPPMRFVDGGRDAAMPDLGESDAGPPVVDAGTDLGTDAGIDMGPLTRAGTCEACETNADCNPGSFCAALATGGRACLPGCIPDLPSCPGNFGCTLSAALEVDEYVCAPLGATCCVDEDRDAYGQGVGCMGRDCDDTSADVNPGEPERCNGSDDDCDGMIDGTMTDCVSGVCRPNVAMPGTYEDIRSAMCVDGACTSGTLTSCGLFSCELGGGLGSRCALDCPSTTPNTGDERCIAAAHCDGNTCLPDEANGGVCDEDSDCASGHCDNGYCCDSGQCCRTAMDCGGGSGAVCDSAATCQGTRGDTACVSNACVVMSGVPDDSACVPGVLARDCGLNVPVYCTGEADQVAPTCPTTCVADTDCVASAHCELGICALDRPPGGGCSRVQDCQDGNSCVDGVCCTSTCAGQCERCDLPDTRGTCTPVALGRDPDGECPGFSCSDYYAGFDGLGACRRRASVDGDLAACNGLGACLAPAELCPSRPAGAEVQIDCNDVCQTPTVGTCNDTTPGACTDAPAGTQTCGLGACMVTVAMCSAGVPVACMAGMSAVEACNGADDNCDGIPDNAAPSALCPPTANVASTVCGGGAGCAIGTCNANAVDVDGSYANGCEVVDEGNGGSCGTATSLGSLGIGAAVNTLSSTIATAGGSDFFFVSFPPLGANGGGTPRIRFTRNDGSAFRFEVTSGCPAAPLGCGSGGTATNLQEWAFVDDQSIPGPRQWTSRNVAWPSPIYVRVFRTTPGASAAQYQLTFTR
jgi:hypothetical protein